MEWASLFTNICSVIFLYETIVWKYLNIMDPVDFSVYPLTDRYKRCREQIEIIRDNLLKTSTSLDLLENENNFLREENEVLLQKKSGQMKNEGNNKKTTKPRSPSAAKGRVELSLKTLGVVLEKLFEFEKVALSQRTSSEEAKEQNRKMKAKFEEAQRNFQRERKRNEQLQEIITAMETQSKREAMSRDDAKRRLHILAKEINGLTQGLSVQKCNSSQMCNNYLKEISSDPHRSSSSDEMVQSLPINSSTPKVNIGGAQAATSVYNSPKRKLAIRWDYWYRYQYYHRQGFPEPTPTPTPAQEENESTWKMWKSVYSSLASIAFGYFIYTTVSSVSNCIQKIFF